VDGVNTCTPTSSRGARPGLPAHPDHHRPADGSYTAVDPDTDYGAGDPITFYVASSGRELENIAMTDVTVYCTETTATQDHLTLSSAAVSATGAFSGSRRRAGCSQDRGQVHVRVQG